MSLTPFGRLRAATATRSFTCSMTVRELEPMRIITMPVTTSPRPSFETEPCRMVWPIATSATSPTRTGVPPWLVTTIPRIWSMSWTWPTPRMTSCSAPLVM